MGGQIHKTSFKQKYQFKQEFMTLTIGRLFCMKQIEKFFL